MRYVIQAYTRDPDGLPTGAIYLGETGWVSDPADALVYTDEALAEYDARARGGRVVRRASGEGVPFISPALAFADLERRKLA